MKVVFSCLFLFESQLGNEDFSYFNGKEFNFFNRMSLLVFGSEFVFQKFQKRIQVVDILVLVLRYFEQNLIIYDRFLINGIVS